MLKKLGYWLLNPWVILSSLVVGIVIGLTANPFHALFDHLGRIYLELLQMCIFPTVVVAVIVSVGNLLHSHISHYIQRLSLVFLSWITIAGLLSIIVSLFIHQWSGLDLHSQAVLGAKLAALQKGTDITINGPAINTIWDFISNLTTTNIFRSLSHGDSLPVLIFCVVLGIALGYTKSSAAKTTLAALDGFYNALLRIVDWLMYALPFGLCFMFGGLMSRIGFDILAPLSKLIILCIVACLVIGVINVIILAKRTEFSFFHTLKAIRTPLFVALGTSSSFAALPTTLQSLQDELKFDRKLIGLIIPIGINFCQQGSILKYTLVVVFVAHLYNSPLNGLAYLTIFFTSIMMSIISSGAPGIAVISMFAIMLQPLGLPIIPGIVLLAMLDPLLDPLVTVLNVLGSCAAAALIIPKQELRPTLIEAHKQNT